MKWKSAALLPLLFVVASCAAEGGSRGSGISSDIQGTVDTVVGPAVSRSPQRAALRLVARLHSVLEIEPAARAQSAVEGIRVAAEGTGARGQTDSNGRFSIAGNFEGRVSLVFQRPGSEATARIVVDVPGGGTLTLNHVRVDLEQGEAIAESQDVEFDGLVVGTNCPELTLTMQSQPSSTLDRYTVRLDTSSIENAQGRPLVCEDLRDGDRASVEGAVNPDGTFGEATIRLAD